jgi:hypothetical protein
MQLIWYARLQIPLISVHTYSMCRTWLADTISKRVLQACGGDGVDGCMYSSC